MAAARKRVHRERRPRRKRRIAFEDRVRYLTMEEWESFFGAVDRLRDRVMLELLYASGMRVGELVSARIEDLDRLGGFLRITGDRTKTGRGRTVVLVPRVRAQLVAWLKEQGQTRGPLFRSQKGGAISVRQVQRLVADYAERAGLAQVAGRYKDGERRLGRVTPHTLRHTHIVHALLRKVPLAAVQRQVGHESLETTAIYAALAPQEVREAYERGF